MRHFAITGMFTVAMISLISLGFAMRATPPVARSIAGTFSRAITATAPDFSATSACATDMTSIMTPPLSISARPVLSRNPEFPLLLDIPIPFSRTPKTEAEMWVWNRLFYHPAARAAPPVKDRKAHDTAEASACVSAVWSCSGIMFNHDARAQEFPAPLCCSVSLFILCGTKRLAGDYDGAEFGGDC